MKQHGIIVHWALYGLGLSAGKRRLAYATLLCALLLIIWGPIAALLTLKPAKYTSEWTLILPGTGNGLAVSLDSIGQASSSAVSPFSSSSVDPVANYKAITLSTPVRAIAAQRLEMDLASFGAPKIKLIDQTALMEFRFSGSTPEDAQNKSYALYEALQEQLNQLRDDEAQHMTESSLQMLAGFNEKLEQAQQHKLSFQVQSDLVSFEQFEGLIARLEDNRFELQRKTAEHRALSMRIETLKTGLRMSNERLKAAIALRNDEAFQQLVDRHADIHTQMSTIDGIWGDEHPQLAQLHAAHHTIDDEISRRGRHILGHKKYNNRDLIELGNQSAHDQELYALLGLISQRDGLTQGIRAQESMIQQLEQRIADSANDSIQLENLSRKQQVATAVFSTALAKQDIGSSNRFSSYPLVQMLAHPTLPENADTTVFKLALAGGFAATLFLISGLGILWIRKPWLQKLVKSA